MGVFVPNQTTSQEPDLRPLNELSYLIVDDSSIARKVLTRELKSFGAREIYGAGEAADAFDILRLAHVDFILLDFEMPMLSGAEFLHLLRRDDSLKHAECFVLMVSSYCDKEHILAARNAGAHGYIIKPFPAKKLEHHIQHIMHHPRDFVRAKGYVGPDRRCHDPGPGFENDRRKDVH
ncbi:response regulator [Terasakiella sp. SH-1]|uniref:response regulator n=1 Tax=Terasakiella sp. SH-1 TaxID=2560057 RepID=UPI0010744464|nr:response regulator [Terasakiella sp. SH-1]